MTPGGPGGIFSQRAGNATTEAAAPANATTPADSQSEEPGQAGPVATQNATQAASGAEAGQPGQQTIPGGSRVDLGGGRMAEVGAVIPPIKADSTVTPRFVSDLAEFLVNAYYPKGTHPAAGASGISTLGLKSLNLRYGGALVGLNKPVDDLAERRRFV